MWRTANAATTTATITATCTERLPERTTEQIEVIPLQQAPTTQVTGSQQHLDESDAVVYPQVCQEQFAAGQHESEHSGCNYCAGARCSVREFQSFRWSRHRQQTVEANKVNQLERVQQRAVEQSVNIFEQLEQFDKRLEHESGATVRQR